MAITELIFPTSGTPTVPTDYAYQNGYLAQNAKGYNAVSLTNWDATTTAPQVASGSAIEINGATWQVDADTTILTTAATSGVNYLVFDDDAGAFGWDDGTPTWSATLNGWYISGDRATGHLCTWDGSTSFSGKSFFDLQKQNDSGLRIDPSGVIFSGVKTDNINIRHKLITGTLDASGDVTVAHGLTVTDILSISMLIDTGSYWRMVTGDVNATDAATLDANATNIVFLSSGTTFASDPYKLLITYSG